VRAASHGGKTDLSAPTFLPSLPPALVTANTLVPSPFGRRVHLSVSSARSRILLVTEFVPDSLSSSVSLFSLLFSLSFSLPGPPLLHQRADPLVRVHRGSCLTREYFTFPCCRGEKNEGSRRGVEGTRQRDVKKFDS